jgi:DNA helicase-2/ATP-dependent DNA helicase PcrA
MELDSSQKKFCHSEADYIRLLAPAGSGKTLSLLWRCKYLYENRGEKTVRFLLFTFTRVARDELKDVLARNPAFVDIRKAVRIETLNKWGLNYLRGIESGLEVKAGKRDFHFLVKNTLRPIWSANKKLTPIIQKNQFKYNTIMELFDTLKSSGFRHDAKNLVDHFEEQYEWLIEHGCEGYIQRNILQPLEDLEFLQSSQSLGGTAKLFLEFWRDSSNHLWNSAIITLDDQKYWSLVKLEEKYKDSFFPEPNRYHHIMVDEFQDINPLDLRLVDTLRRVNQSTLLIVGDDDQAIFEWRGSTPNFIISPSEHFAVDFENHKLEANYRSPKNIVEHSQKLIANNTFRVPKTVTPMQTTVAKIVVKSYDSHMDSIQAVLNLARAAQENEERKAIAVIGRKKSQLIPLQILLTSNNISYYAKQDLNVLLSYVFGDLKEILIAIASQTERKSPKEVCNSFLRMTNKVETYDLRREEQKKLYYYLIQQRPHTVVDALRLFGNFDGSLRGKSGAAQTIKYYEAITNILECGTVADAVNEIGVEFAGFRKHFAKSEDDIFYKEPPFLYLAEYATRYGDDFFGFIDHVEEAIDLMRDSGLNEDEIDTDYWAPVHLMTAQSAKGKEFDTVIILDVNDGIFPSKLAETAREIEQERRVFYVAVTRAKKNLLMFPVKRILDRPVTRSPYIKEMGIS